MADIPTSPDPATTDKSASAEQIIDLRNPLLATALAVLWPGLGHVYQRRTGKAILYMICVLGTYFYGWSLGGGKVVYACWEPAAFRRYAYLSQVWVGLPAWPAMIQATFGAPLGESFMVPPRYHRDGGNDLAEWNRRYPVGFELGTVLTMVAGLLNVLVIFDAAAGPVGAVPLPQEKRDRSKVAIGSHG